METEKLYYADPFLTEFDARVLACEAVKDGFAVVLDRTAFYPEGGGQPYDTGVLGGAEVLDVHERAGVITHKCASPLPVGAAVHGKIDRARRFDHMQQHSGEHICSGLICARYGCDNVGFHMGAESVTIDFNADIPWEELLELEAAANRYIYEDHAIDIQLHRGAELDAIDYRSKKPLEGDVRIVTFPGADCCACCGTHVMRSGQVGIVKFLSVQKIRVDGRVGMVCGGQAYAAGTTKFREGYAGSAGVSVSFSFFFFFPARTCLRRSRTEGAFSIRLPILSNASASAGLVMGSSSTLPPSETTKKAIGVTVTPVPPPPPNFVAV